ncbi:UNVERIFIED_CONTAM: hypothetical protein Slati_2850300 [Sesamum latifolium]|uniref:Uncharacterized protein n=1 Tax=Sesamum latifolium TaxID=2727402 RepID=A0AAW2VCU9_9LAMI
MYIRSDSAVHLLESVEAGVLVGQGGADPRLRIAHLPPEVGVTAEALQCRQRLAQFLHGVAHLLHAVAECSLFPLAAALYLGEEVRGLADASEADLDGQLGQFAGVAAPPWEERVRTQISG